MSRRRRRETDDIVAELPTSAALALVNAHLVCGIEADPWLLAYLIDRYVLRDEAAHARACERLGELLGMEAPDIDAIELLEAQIDLFEAEHWEE